MTLTTGTPVPVVLFEPPLYGSEIELMAFEDYRDDEDRADALASAAKQDDEFEDAAALMAVEVEANND